MMLPRFVHWVREPRAQARLFAWSAIGAALLPMSVTVHAAPEEIQVYIDDMDSTGEFGLDTHVNYVLSGESTGLDDGTEDSVHRVRITPEFSYGLTHNLEAGLYLPLTTVDRSGHFYVSGAKGRLKYVVHPEGNPNFWYGANLEIGRVDHRLDLDPWNAELKAIVGMRTRKWLLALNGNIDFVISGPRRDPASLEITTKVSYSLNTYAAIGFESYNGAGPLKSPGRFGSSEQTVLAASDVSFGKWDLNLGIGRGFGTNPDRLVVKAIIGVPIEGLLGK